MSINWKASLVPAAAVIPAPTVYTNTVAVKTLVVDFEVQRPSMCVLPERREERVGEEMSERRGRYLTLSPLSPSLFSLFLSLVPPPRSSRNEMGRGERRPPGEDFSLGRKKNSHTHTDVGDCRGEPPFSFYPSRF